MRLPVVLLALILLVKAVLGGVVAWQVPLWTAYHHEIDTYNIARLMAEERRLPSPADFPPGEYEVRQGSQPPLYGLVAAPVVGVFGAAGRVTTTLNPAPFCIGGDDLVVSFETDRSYNFPPSGHARGGFALRLLNVGYGLVAVAFLYAAGRVAFPGGPFIAVAAAAMLAFEPYTVALNSTIINDNLLLAVAAAHLYVAARLLRGGRPHPLTVGVLFGLAAVAVGTKINGWVTVGASVVLVAGVFASANGLRLSRRGWLAVGAFGVLLVLGVGGVLAFNLWQYGTIYGRYDNLAAELAALWRGRGRVLGAIPPTLAFTLNDYAAALRDVPLPGRVVRAYSLTAAALPLLGLWGLTRAVLRREWTAAGVYAFAGLTFAGAAALVIVRSAGSQLNTDVGSIIFAPVRYYAVGLPGLLLAASAGAHALLPVGWARGNPAGLAVAAGWLGLSVAAAAFNIPGAILRESRSPALDVPSAAGVSLAAIDVQPGDDLLNITLEMGTTTPVTENVRGRVELRGADGVTFGCTFVPLRGIYPTPRWEPGEVVRQRLALENCAAPMRGPVGVMFSWVAEDGTASPAHTETLDGPLAVGASCPPNLGTVGGELQLSAINTPPTAAPGRGYEPLVNWVVLAQPLRAQRRMFTLTNGTAAYSCMGFADIHDGVYSTQQFGDLRRAISPGLTIYSDGCVVTLPPDAPPGVYQIDVRLTDANGLPLPVDLPDGNTADRLLLDTVTVR